jgi:hypothetical protein
MIKWTNIIYVALVLILSSCEKSENKLIAYWEGDLFQKDSNNNFILKDSTYELVFTPQGNWKKSLNGTDEGSFEYLPQEQKIVFGQKKYAYSIQDSTCILASNKDSLVLKKVMDLK